MQVYCPNCQKEVIEAKLFRAVPPMECPHCKTELEFTMDTASKAPFAMGIIILIMTLHTFGIVSDGTYKVFLISGVVIIAAILLSSKIIAQEIKK